MSRETSKREEILQSLNRESLRGSANGVLFNQAVATRLGIHPTDLKVASLLAQKGALTAGQLAEHTGLTTGAATFIIDRLEKAGYVQRVRNPHDRRSVLIELKQERAASVGEYFVPMARVLEKVSAAYSDEELAVILKFMLHNNEAVEEEIARLHKDATAKEKREG
ncbi:MarR family transcriptional regulator [Ktedonosporobacter rubrisoli]|uniref:MarR family transcriptional regulator n=1 Tax=Ktedonosporobacter rubrisoli TaxID=2509675 RepID=A0A4P6JJY5_KTERU|nr:MarR family transcriptional regulator [Ktedonosporobacter rubrisoli]QBD75467.1 MarR family transcriptional regulator [Ktedonosporobacter rubrisoli]